MRRRIDKAEVGAWNARCDRCGWKFKNYELFKTWDGYYVDRECWEIRHPQDFVRGIPDDPSVPLEAIEGATDRVLLAAYTFASDRIGTALCAATARGVQCPGRW